jgi:hypothetical protein
MMEPKTASEELPALYRAILDRVAELDASGRRELANLVRAEATRIYSRSWDDRARRNLQALLRRHSAAPVGQETTGRGLRRRSVRAV